MLRQTTRPERNAGQITALAGRVDRFVRVQAAQVGLNAGQKLGDALLKNRGRAIHVAGTLGIDRWQGNERMQLRIIDVASSDPVERAKG